MQIVDFKSLVSRFNASTCGALGNAAAICVNRARYEKTTEHFLLRRLEEPLGDAQLILKQAGLDPFDVAGSAFEAWGLHNKIVTDESDFIRISGELDVLAVGTVAGGDLTGVDRVRLA